MRSVSTRRNDGPADDDHNIPTDTGISRWHWAVFETLAGPDHASLILDGDSPRNFSRPNRASLARYAAAAHMIDPLLHEVTASRETKSKYFPVCRDERMQNLIAVPMFGPSGAIHAVAMWLGDINEPLPRMPIIGAAEWTASGLVSASPAAMFLLRTAHGDALTNHTIPEMLAALDSLDDRAGFLEMFNLTNLGRPADQWSGIASTTDESGQPHKIHLALRAVLVNGERVVRAVIADVSGIPTADRPDLTLAAVRHMPVPPGQALALCDLKTGFVHEWMCPVGSPLSSFRHHNPIFDDDSKLQVVNACFSLAAGVADTATIRARMRFSADEEWIELDACWTRICGGERPQALITIRPLSPIPTPVVRSCRACQELADHTIHLRP
ncbi:DUF5593 domain-containing protein [Nocardia sp. 2]|uniref:DUF5593 domain-containing protein n=1 Tax=Nocardia acididurans TaxID=2802282 RepID=A0ABS1MHE7_9NOCA|nr:GAF domain-containing protein [Nocardia acididurans]MBL1080088.1 DUF5593 domain-containing protein [Nocardia acididurans]